MSGQSRPNPVILQRIVDAHCHPTDKPIPSGTVDGLNMHLCIMATREDDQSKVADLAAQASTKITPAFGWHPWTSHRISLLDHPLPKREHYASILLSNEAPPDHFEAFDVMLDKLPEPIGLSTLLAELRQNLSQFPNALLGEVGIDRAFRVPYTPYPHADGGKLTPFRVPPEHQLALLEAQINVAIELRRSISFHSVKSQELTLQLLKRLKDMHGVAFGRINIDLHSCQFSNETWKTVERMYPNVFLSVSIVINTRSPAFESIIKSCSATRLMAESDYNDITKVEAKTWEVVQYIAQVRGWDLETVPWDDDDGRPEEEWGVVRRLAANWRRFVGPGMGLAHSGSKPNRRVRRQNDFHSDSDEE